MIFLKPFVIKHRNNAIKIIKQISENLLFNIFNNIKTKLKGTLF